MPCTVRLFKDRFGRDIIGFIGPCGDKFVLPKERERVLGVLWRKPWTKTNCPRLNTYPANKCLKVIVNPESRLGIHEQDAVDWFIETYGTIDAYLYHVNHNKLVTNPTFGDMLRTHLRSGRSTTA